MKQGRKKYRGIIIAGGTGAGKTTSLRKLINLYPGNKLIYDINSEHEGGIICDFPIFLAKASRAVNSLIVFEEATIFLSNKGDAKKLREILVTKRHRNNIIILVFHSLRAIPVYIFDLTDLLILHKTVDNYSLISRKLDQFDKVLSSFDELKRDPSPYARRFVYLR